MKEPSEDTSDVLVVGAGPTGLMLAGELAAQGVATTLVERRNDQESNLTRAFAVQARTLELLDVCGVADELIRTGKKITHFRLFDRVDVDLSKLPSRFPYVLVTPQYETERVLHKRASSHGAQILYNTELVAFRQSDSGIQADLRSGEGAVRTHRASFLIGTDGVHSTVRRQLGMPFPGHPSKIAWLILADVQLRETPPDVFTVNASGEDFAFIAPFGDGWYRAFVWNRRLDLPEDARITLDPVREITRRVLGTDFGMHSPRWISRFHNEERQVAQYRDERVFLAGDAAHVHSPAGAQGMNTGLQDAMNLGWKMASVLRNHAEIEFLDTYNSERHPIGRAVVLMTEFLVRLVAFRNPFLRSARSTFGSIAMRLPLISAIAPGGLSGIAIRYPKSSGAHRLVGRRIADIPLAGEPPSPTRLYEALRQRRFVFVESSRNRDSVQELLKPWTDQLAFFTAGSGRNEPLMLVRPDGYIAWASYAGSSRRRDIELFRAVEHWCGRPTGERGDARIAPAKVAVD